MGPGSFCHGGGCYCDRGGLTEFSVQASVKRLEIAAVLLIVFIGSYIIDYMYTILT